MRSGKLDRKITIQRSTSSQDENSGQLVDTWTALAHQRWASVKQDAGGDESFKADQTVARQHVIFEIRYSADFLPSSRDRILYPAPDSGAVQSPDVDTIHDIIEVVEIGRRVGLKIRTVRRTEHAR